MYDNLGNDISDPVLKNEMDFGIRQTYRKAEDRDLSQEDVELIAMGFYTRY